VFFIGPYEIPSGIFPSWYFLPFFHH
jgi:hypothetical protein